MRLTAANIHSGNLGQVIEVPGHITGVLEAYWKDGDTYQLVVGGEEVDVLATESIHVYRDAVLGAMHRREKAEEEQGGVLTEGDLERLTERILDRLGLAGVVAA